MQPAWSLDLDHVTRVDPAYDADRAFFGVEGDQILAYDTRVGQPEWTVQASPLMTPTAGGGLLFTVEPGALRALRQDTGAVEWALPFDEPLAVPPVWDNGWLVAATTSGTVLAFRASDGELIWRYNLGARLHASPALGTDRVYISVADHRVVALQVQTGAPLWERRLGGAPNDMLALDDRLYVGSDDNFLYCLHADDGEVAWRWRTGADVIGVPVADDRRVYFVSMDNVLRALDLRSGAQRWKRSLPNRPTRGPVRVADTLLVSGLATRVSAYLMNDGTPAGELTATGELAGAPHATEVRGLPQVMLVARDLEHGTRVSAVRRSVEPDIKGVVTMPNAVMLPAPAPAASPAAGAVAGRPAGSPLPSAGAGAATDSSGSPVGSPTPGPPGRR